MIKKKIYHEIIFIGVSKSVHLAATKTTAPQLATVISMGQADTAII